MRTPENIVSSLFFYMWNAWDEKECKITFGPMYKHFWDKWCSLTNYDVYGATEKFYSELSDNNRELLVNRAIHVYDGRARRPQIHTSTLVCKYCGSSNVDKSAWVNVNTNEYTSDSSDCDDEYCNECEIPTGLMLESRYLEMMEEFWDALDDQAKSSQIEKYLSKSSLMDPNEWWKSLSYDKKREVFSKRLSSNT